MKCLLKDQISPEILKDASSSAQSKYDQEMGASAASRHDGMLMKNSAFCWSPYGIDLDPTRRVFAEALGTFILMFCICGITMSTQLMGRELVLLEYAATAALTVTVVVFSIGSISGAHVNPAVTIAFAAFGEFPWPQVPLYVLAQIGGSVLATYVGGQIYGIESTLLTTRPLRGCTFAFWVELIATFIIMFLAMSLTKEAHCVGHLSGFVVGVAIGLTMLITGPVSGGSMNPARSLGPAIVSWKFDDIWIYIVAPTIGAVAGALMFHILRVRCCTRCSSSSSSPDTSLFGHSLHSVED